MHDLNEFVQQYLQERESHISTNVTNLPGLWGRLTNSKYYWSKYRHSEQAVTEFGVSWVTEHLTRKTITKKNLKLYKASLKNTNAKLKERSDFILAITAMTTLLGMTSAIKPSLLGIAHPPLCLAAGIIIILLTAGIERIAMLKKSAENEEIINVIDAAT